MEFSNKESVVELVKKYAFQMADQFVANQMPMNVIQDKFESVVGLLNVPTLASASTVPKSHEKRTKRTLVHIGGNKKQAKAKARREQKAKVALRRSQRSGTRFNK